MRCYLLTLLFSLFAVLTRAQTGPPLEGPDRGYAVKIGQQAPSDFILKLTDGHMTSLKGLRGKVVVLQLTASYCSVCRLKFPHLEKELWKPSKHKSFILIAVDRDESLATAIKFKKEVKITYPMALDPGAKIFKTFTTKDAGIARDIVIDQNGKIVFLSRLFSGEEFHRMKVTIDSLLSKS